MKKLEVTLGRDSSSYATIHVEVPDQASEKEIVKATRDAYDALVNDEDQFGRDIVFEDSFEFSGLRIVSTFDEERNLHLESVPIETSPHDLGVALIEFLAGRDTFADLFGMIEKQGVRVSPERLAALRSMVAWLNCAAPPQSTQHCQDASAAADVLERLSKANG